MTTQLITRTAPAPKVSGPTPSGPVRHRHIRTASAIAGVCALLATGGYVATTMIGADSPSTAGTGSTVNPGAQTMRELQESVAGQYGSRPVSDATVSPSARIAREQRESVAGQYGSPPASDATVSPSARTMREQRESVAGQYGSPPASDAAANPTAQARHDQLDQVTGRYGLAR